MLPDEFQAVLLARLPQAEGISAVRTLADLGHTQHPFGVAVRLESGAQVWWQIVYASALGTPASPGAGPRVLPEMPALPRKGPVRTALVEELLAAVVLTEDTHGQIARLERYSTREQPPQARFGFTVEYRDGSKVFVSALATIKPGGRAPDRFHRPADEV